MSIPPSIDPLVVIISRPEVETGDTSSTVNVLNSLIQSPDQARAFHERVDIAFHGYDHDRRELFETPEVRSFVYQIDDQFPYWLFFLSKHHLGLQCLLLCFLLPFLTDEARARIFPQRSNERLLNRWFLAVNYICQYVGMTENELELLTDCNMRYITEGLPPFAK